ncbi:hypothetical protein MTO96_043486 [Rhipicephalus appendiculatus]
MKRKLGAVGIVVPVRRALGALQDKVKAELQHMEAQGDIIKPEVRYFGHILSTEGLHLDPGRVKDILEMEEPKNCKELQVFLGMMNYVHFIPNMSDLTAPPKNIGAQRRCVGLD